MLLVFQMIKASVVAQLSNTGTRYSQRYFVFKQNICYYRDRIVGNKFCKRINITLQCQCL